MRILLTGAGGFLGTELVHYWKNTGHDIVPTTRKELELTNSDSVESFFRGQSFDAVIHTAVKGGSRLRKDSFDDLVDNLCMFQNLIRFKKHYGVMINFGSGAEFDRSKPIVNAAETTVLRSNPQDYYGMSKNLITKEILACHENVFNLRLFGCFGIYEEPQRLLKNSFRKIKAGMPAEIQQNRQMSYFFAEDVGRVIDYILSNPDKQIKNDINLCYDKSWSLSEIVQIIVDQQSGAPTKVNDHEWGDPYTGAATRLQSMGIGLIGLRKGIEICLKSWNKSLSL